jgi:hypothetical protein
MEITGPMVFVMPEELKKALAEAYKKWPGKKLRMRVEIQEEMDD